MYEKRQSIYDINHGEGSAAKIIGAPYKGTTTAKVAEELGVTRQYISLLYVRLTGRTWSSVLNEVGLKTRGPRNGNHHPETV